MWIVSRDDLLSALDRVEAAADDRSPHPFVGMVLISESERGLKFTTTNLLMAIETSCSASISPMVPAIAVSHRKLRTMVGTMPADKLKCTLDKSQRLVVKCSGQRQFSLVTTPAEEYPRVPTPPADAQFITVDPHALSRAIDRVRYAVPSAKDRPQLDCVRVEVLDNQLSVVAASGPAMSVWTEPVEAATSKVSIPSMAFKPLRLVAAAHNDKTPFEFSVGPRELYVRCGSMYLVACLPSGEFPPWRALLDVLQLRKVAQIGALAMLDALRAVSAAAPGKGVQCVLHDDGTLDINALGECEARDSIKVELPQDAVAFSEMIDVLVDPVMFIDTIKGADKDFTLEWTGGDQLAVRTDEGFLGILARMVER